MKAAQPGRECNEKSAKAIQKNREGSRIKGERQFERKELGTKITGFVITKKANEL